MGLLHVSGMQFLPATLTRSCRSGLRICDRIIGLLGRHVTFHHYVPPLGQAKSKLQDWTKVKTYPTDNIAYICYTARTRRPQPEKARGLLCSPSLLEAKSNIKPDLFGFRSDGVSSYTA